MKNMIIGGVAAITLLASAPFAYNAIRDSQPQLFGEKWLAERCYEYRGEAKHQTRCAALWAAEDAFYAACEEAQQLFSQYEELAERTPRTTRDGRTLVVANYDYRIEVLKKNLRAAVTLASISCRERSIYRMPASEMDQKACELDRAAVAEIEADLRVYEADRAATLILEAEERELLNQMPQVTYKMTQAAFSAAGALRNDAWPVCSRRSVEGDEPDSETY